MIERKQRLSLKEYTLLCVKEMRLYWRQMLAPLAVILFLQLFIRIDINYTDSLPNHAYLTIKGSNWNLQRGDYAVFGFPTENPSSPFRKGDHLVKIIAGVPGDTVVVDENGVIRIRGEDQPGLAKIGGSPAGIAKPYTKSGRPIQAIKGGVIPKGQYYMYAPHPDSLDSRYAMVGLVDKSNIQGKTIPLF
jgi:conjugal transfer pilin signal peptidase TrbI